MQRVEEEGEVEEAEGGVVDPGEDPGVDPEGGMDEAEDTTTMEASSRLQEFPWRTLLR